MRLTQNTLLKAAKTYVTQRTARDKHIICVYLTGSIIDDRPLLGGTADIDLVFVHDDVPESPREIVRFTPTVHLDLAHHDQNIYREPKNLRLDPWIGSYLIKDPIVLHGTQHWFEFVQASVFSKFSLPENIYGRALPLIENARQTWLNFQLDPQEPDIEHIWGYLKALEDASNALMILEGPPLTERRFMLDFSERITRMGHPDIANMVTNLLIPNQEIISTLPHWLQIWSTQLQSLENDKNYPIELHPHRINYYTKAAEALSEDHPAAASWILFKTWTRFVLFNKKSKEKTNDWYELLNQNWMLGENFEPRLNELDQFLDICEEIIENWAKTNGIEV